MPYLSCGRCGLQIKIQAAYLLIANCSDIWAAGIMRRAAQGAGRRLTDRGRIHDPEHFTDAGFEEMCALVSGTNGPSANELAERHELLERVAPRDVEPSSSR